MGALKYESDMQVPAGEWGIKCVILLNKKGVVWCVLQANGVFFVLVSSISIAKMSEFANFILTLIKII